MIAKTLVKILSKADNSVAGTGFLITKDGFILTCYHVLQEAFNHNPKNYEEVLIEYQLGNRITAVFYSDYSSVNDDIGLLKCESDESFTAAALGTAWNSTDKLQIYGYQYDELAPFPEIGILTGTTTYEGKERLVIKDAKHIKYGVSGAPTFNTRTRKVIGILSEKWKGQEGEGTAFIIPISTFIEKWQQLEQLEESVSLVDESTIKNLAISTDLINQIKSNSCVVVLGPNISISTHGQIGIASEWQLAGELAQQCNYNDDKMALPQVAQFYENKVGRSKLERYIINQLSKPVFPLLSHHLIASLPFRSIIYACYDNLINQALQIRNIPYTELIVSENTTNVESSTNYPLLIKLNGTIVDKDSLVITATDYEMWPQLICAYFKSLKHLLSDHTYLFIGFNLEDHRLDHVYRCLKQAGWLAEETFHYAVQLNPQPYNTVYWNDKNVQVIDADPTLFLKVVAYQARYPKQIYPKLDLSELHFEPEVITRKDLQELTSRFDSILQQLGVPSLVESIGDFSLNESQLLHIRDMRMEVELMKSGIESSLLTESPQYLVKIGNIELASGNINQAEELYLRAIELDPTNAEAHYNLHFVLLEKGRLDDATIEYKTAIQLKPQYSVVPPAHDVQEILGKGGMGVVYKVTTPTAKTVAIKVLKRSLTRNYRAIERFKREALLTKRLQHPNIVKILDSGTQRNKFYIVYEYLRGRDLKQEMENREIPPVEAYEIISTTCRAIGYAHKREVIHRDIKPSNIYLTSDGIKVIDFGLAQHISSSQLTSVGFATGTLSYMSPEQKYGLGTESFNPRTDIYSVGVTLYELLTGRLPEGNYKLPSQINAKVEKTIDIIISKALAYDPNERYQEIEKFLSDLMLVQSATHNMVLIPAGEFTMGDNRFHDEIPQRTVYLDSYYIDKYPITNEEFQQFDSTHVYPLHKAHHPVVAISWQQAKDYAQWAGKRLPTEAEWEKAARGTDLREYPWGNEFDLAKCNMAESGIGDTLPVGHIPENISPYGCYDMAGNVWEWTSDWYEAYPGSDIKDNNYGQTQVAIRGASFRYWHYRSTHLPPRCADRFHYSPEGEVDIGFRCVKEVENSRGSHTE